MNKLARNRRRNRRITAVLLAGALMAPGLALPAVAEDPTYVPWSQLLPGLSTQFNPSSANLCNRGDVRCVDAVINEMKRRFKPLAESCNHNAVFSLTYLRTTQEYRRAVENPNYFDSNARVNHEDAVFASYYFKAYDDWYKRDRKRRVPAAWKIAFQAADGHKVSGSGSLLLGMNAHINRDLPFVLEAIGGVSPKRKPDHDKVNEILNRVTGPVLAETARRFDPTIDDGGTDLTTLDETTFLQIVVAWREEAWRNAERLVAARTPEQRANTAKSIEAAAAAEAQTIYTSTAYNPPLTSTQARDAYCALHWNDA